MKKFALLLSLLCFTSCAFASEAYQVPGSYKETVTETVVTPANSAVSAADENVTQEKKKFKLFKRKYRDFNPQNSYWNFGRPTFWTGSI